MRSRRGRTGREARPQSGLWRRWVPAQVRYAIRRWEEPEVRLDRRDSAFAIDKGWIVEDLGANVSPPKGGRIRYLAGEAVP